MSKDKEREIRTRLNEPLPNAVQDQVANALDKISEAWSRGLKNPRANPEDVMVDAVTPHLTGNAEIDDLLLGYARDTLLFHRTRQQRGGHAR